MLPGWRVSSTLATERNEGSWFGRREPGFLAAPPQQTKGGFPPQRSKTGFVGDPGFAGDPSAPANQKRVCWGPLKAARNDSPSGFRRRCGMESPDVHARLGHPATARRAAFVLARRVSAGNHCPRNLSPFRGDTLADVPPLMGLLYLYGTLTPGLRPGLTQMSPLHGLPCRQIHQRDKKSDDYRLEVAPPQAGFARVGVFVNCPALAKAARTGHPQDV